LGSDVPVQSTIGVWESNRKLPRGVWGGPLFVTYFSVLR